jgi:hypothetical protein
MIDEQNAGLKTALAKEREANRELKALGITIDDIAAIKAGADLHQEFQALLRQHAYLAELDKAALVAERDKVLVALNSSNAKLALAAEFISMGGNHVTVDLLTPLYAPRIRYEPNGKVTILTENGDPALPGCTIRDLALAARAKYPTQFR